MALSLTNSFLQTKPISPPLPAPPKGEGEGGRESWAASDVQEERHTPGILFRLQGNHPFYLGNRSGVLVDADQVEKFRKKYGGLSEIMEIPVLKGEIILPTRKKSSAGKGGKKK
ncbi:50S RIBOSOMAL PROTEIN L31 [Salix viminalis]|uniref:Large ribosomal subunit protein bL31c n=1 Tax=Salix viminalis TaxID=40686 RepID=A0A9Q0UJ43_SALVM|nr:50S RIBOSOMAL PROTEIN L31 [Salix viminalis]